MTRRNLGHTQTLTLKLHPDLMAWLNAEAAANYCTAAEVVRRLIISAARDDLRHATDWHAGRFNHRGEDGD